MSGYMRFGGDLRASRMRHMANARNSHMYAQHAELVVSRERWLDTMRDSIRMARLDNHLHVRRLRAQRRAALLDGLYRLQEFCMGHGFDAEVDSDALCVYVDIPWIDDKGGKGATRERVTTRAQARAVLGY